MCSPVPCSKCGKTTWSGCGAHIESVKKMVPADQWCDGHGDDSGQQSGGIFSKLFGR